MRGILLLTFLLSIFEIGHSKSVNSHASIPDEPGPWFTGPLLTPSGHVIPVGYVNFEPYIFVNVINGQYDNDWHSFSIPKFYNTNLQLPLYVGITKWMDILIIPQASWNKTQNASTFVFNDFLVGFDFLILEDTPTNNLPGIKAYIQETFPTGPYQKRKVNKKGTDIGGQGSFVTSLGFVITRTFHIYDTHYLAIRFNGFYDIPSRVHVRGLNTYGGAPNTNAKIKVGQALGFLYGMEYSLSQNWALAIDLFGNYKFKTKFSGNPGTNADGTPAALGNPPSFQFSLSPAIEYNFNESIGIIGGVWFTVAGKNATRFISAVIAINYFGPEKTEEVKFKTSGGGGGE